MASLTENESKTLEFLIRNFSRDFNINQLAKELEISPGGMFKILKKLLKQNFVTQKRVGNNLIYKIYYNSPEALDACKFALIEKKTTPYINVWIKDLEILKEKAEIAILFGSILTKGKKAEDIDLLLVFEKNKFKDIENSIETINKIKLKRIHAIYQTKGDLVENIKKQDPAVLEEIKTGIILIGRDQLVEAIKNGQS